MKLCLSYTFVKIWMFTSVFYERAMILVFHLPFLDLCLPCLYLSVLKAELPFSCTEISPAPVSGSFPVL